MGHGLHGRRTAVVRPIVHGGFVIPHGPWVMGEKSLNGVKRLGMLVLPMLVCMIVGANGSILLQG